MDYKKLIIQIIQKIKDNEKLELIYRFVKKMDN